MSVLGAVFLVAGAAAWYRTRVPLMHALLVDVTPQRFGMTPGFLSASIGRGRPIGGFSQAEIDGWTKAGGDVPASRVDMLGFRVDEPGTTLSRVDPGLCWILHAASLLGMPLSIAGVARFEECVDFFCLFFAALLALRIWNPLVAGLTGLLYGACAAIPLLTSYVSYYFWGVPVALLLAHLTLFVLGSARLRPMWWCLLVAASMCAIWLRAIWLPILLVFLPAVTGLAFARKRWMAIAACVMALAVSYGALVTRVAHEGLGDALHPRSSLWHALYLGLGAYGDWGDIRWKDEYGYRIAAAARISQNESKDYDNYLRGRFLDEISRHPLKYAAQLLRRAGDFVDSARSSIRGPDFFRQRSWLGWAFLVLLVVGMAIVRKGEPSEIAVAGLYVLVVAVWSLFLPPLSPYPVETMGLACPLFAGVFLKWIDILWARARRLAPSAKGDD